MEASKNPMEEIVKKLGPADLATLMQFMRMSMGESATRPLSVKVELPPIDLKLDGPATYLSWSRRVRYTLTGRNLEGFLTGDRVEPIEGATGRDEWKSTHMLVYIWLLNSMVPSIAATVDGIEKVKDVWEKLRRTYDWVGNNLRVFQIKREIYAAVQGDRTVQEYSIELERLWLEHDHFSPRASCKDPECKKREALNCGEVGHLEQACTKPPKERNSGGRGQTRGRGCGRRGRRGSGRGGYRANLMVADDEGEADVVFTDEDHEFLEMLKRKRRVAVDGDRKGANEDASTSTSSRGNFASYAHSAKGTHDTHALASISTSRSLEWIVETGASRHVIGTASEFSSYSHLVVLESIQTADGTAQPVVGKGTVIFLEKGSGRRLGTGTWHSELWYLDREGMDSALTSMVESAGVRGVGQSVEDVLLLHHRRMGHSSFSLLSRLYPSLYEKANKQKLDNRPSVGKLDPRAVKCVFVGYSATQKGYVCWNPVEKRLFVSMDVSFREFEPYYTLEVNSPFGDSPDTSGIRREGESSRSDGKRQVHVPCTVVVEESVEEPEDEEEEIEPEGGETQAQGELRVYTRRRRQNDVEVPVVPVVLASPLSRPTPTPETPTPSTSDSNYTGDMIPLPSPDPMVLRRTSRSNAGHPPDRFGFPHDIAQFVSYSNITSPDKVAVRLGMTSKGHMQTSKAGVVHHIHVKNELPLEPHEPRRRDYPNCHQLSSTSLEFPAVTRSSYQNSSMSFLPSKPFMASTVAIELNISWDEASWKIGALSDGL
ncbi:hypothetical protein SADUNF_Sadunf19G0035400 [Salix dunnii]|uniref:CCHC-type domain-containing protein n=1 Tax=Salix dunnii TaxID=1413687 RepID=A0A835IY88_9ROSI|nr:hypothetical protein SADUNF_Sadunf19G0035400 [Salix dunnii]